MCMTVSAATADNALGALRANGVDAYVLGEIVEGGEKLLLC